MKYNKTIYLIIFIIVLTSCNTPQIQDISPIKDSTNNYKQIVKINLKDIKIVENSINNEKYIFSISSNGNFVFTISKDKLYKIDIKNKKITDSLHLKFNPKQKFIVTNILYSDNFYAVLYFDGYSNYSNKEKEIILYFFDDNLEYTKQLSLFYSASSKVNEVDLLSFNSFFIDSINEKILINQEFSYIEEFVFPTLVYQQTKSGDVFDIIEKERYRIDNNFLYNDSIKVYTFEDDFSSFLASVCIYNGKLFYNFDKKYNEVNLKTGKKTERSFIPVRVKHQFFNGTYDCIGDTLFVYYFE